MQDNTVLWNDNNAPQGVDEMTQETESHELLLVKCKRVANELVCQFSVELNSLIDKSIQEAVIYCIEQLHESWKIAQEKEHANSPSIQKQEGILQDFQNECYWSYFHKKPAGYNNTFCHRLVEEQVENNSLKIAMDFEDGKYQFNITYHELNKRANQLAHQLCELKTKFEWNDEKPIGLYFENTPELALCLLAVWKAGLVPLLLTRDRKLPIERTAYYIDIAKPQYIIIQDSLVKTDLISFLEHNQNTIPKKSYSNIMADSENMEDTNLDNANPVAYISFSSASTGIPKCIKNFHVGLANSLSYIFRMLKLTPDDRVGWYSSPAFDATILDIFTAWAHGLTLIPIPTNIRNHSSQFDEYLGKMKVSQITLPPKILHQLNANAHLDLQIISTGEDVGKKLFDQWGSRVFNGYGPNECAVCALVTQYQEDRGVDIGNEAVDGLRWFLLERPDETKPFPRFPGLASSNYGELYLSGAGLGEYIHVAKDDSSHYKRFRAIRHPDKNIKELIWVYQTGDVFELTESKHLKFHQRVDDQFKFNGELVHPGAIEHAIRAYTLNEQNGNLIKFVKVLKNTNDRNNQPYIAAYLCVERPLTKSDIRMLHIYLQHNHFCNMVPHRFFEIQTGDWPCNERGKLDVDKLRQVNFTMHFVSHPFELRNFTNNEKLNTMANECAKIWHEVLGIDQHENQLSLDDDFYYLGGNSMMAYKMLTHVDQLCGKDVSVQYNIAVFNEHPTLRNIVIHYAKAHDLIKLATIKRCHQPVIRSNEKNFTSPVVLVNSVTGDSKTEFKHLVNLWSKEFSRVPLYSMSVIGDPQCNISSLPKYASICADEIIESLKKSGRWNETVTLIGFSAGGTLANAIAHHLEQQGRSVAVLCVDTRSAEFYQKLPQSDYAKEIYNLMMHMEPVMGMAEDTVKKCMRLEDLKKYPKHKQLSIIWARLSEKLKDNSISDRESYLNYSLILSNLVYNQLDYETNNVENMTLFSFSDTVSKCSEDRYLGFPQGVVKQLITINGEHSDFIELDKSEWVKSHIVPELKNILPKISAEIVDRHKKRAAKHTIDTLRSLYKKYAAAQQEYSPVEILDYEGNSVDLLNDIVRPIKEKDSMRVLISGHVGISKTTLLKRIRGLLSEHFPDRVVFYVPMRHLQNSVISGDLQNRIARLIYKYSLIKEFQNLSSKNIGFDDILSVIQSYNSECIYLLDDVDIPLLSNLSSYHDQLVKALMMRDYMICSADSNYQQACSKYLPNNTSKYVLSGIQKNNRDNFVKNFIRHKIPEDKLLERITSCINDITILNELAEHPLCLSATCDFLVGKGIGDQNYRLFQLVEYVTKNILSHGSVKSAKDKSYWNPLRANGMGQKRELFLKKLAFYGLINHVVEFSYKDLITVLQPLSENEVSTEELIQVLKGITVFKIQKSLRNQNEHIVCFISDTIQYFYAAKYCHEIIQKPKFYGTDVKTLADFVNDRLSKNYLPFVLLLSGAFEEYVHNDESGEIMLNCDALLQPKAVTDLLDNEINSKIQMIKSIHAKEFYSENKNIGNEYLEKLLSTKIMSEKMSKEVQDQIDNILDKNVTIKIKVGELYLCIEEIVEGDIETLEEEMMALEDGEDVDINDVLKQIVCYEPDNSIVSYLNKAPAFFVGKTLRIHFFGYNIVSEIEECQKPNRDIKRFLLENKTVIEIKEYYYKSGIERVHLERYAMDSWHSLLSRVHHASFVKIESTSQNPIIKSGRYTMKFHQSNESGIVKFLKAIKNVFTSKSMNHFILESEVDYLKYLLSYSGKYSDTKEVYVFEYSYYLGYDDYESHTINKEDLLAIDVQVISRKLIEGLNNELAKTRFKIETSKPDPLKEKIKAMKEIDELKTQFIEILTGEYSPMVFELVNQFIRCHLKELDSTRILNNIKLSEIIGAILKKYDQIQMPQNENELLIRYIKLALYQLLVKMESSLMVAHVMGLLKNSFVDQDLIANLDVIPVIGITGVGKSTLINALRGFPQMEKTNKYGNTIIDIDEKKCERFKIDLSVNETAKIGHSIAISETSNSTCFSIIANFTGKFQTSGIGIVDSTGFIDTRGPQYDLAGALSLDSTIKNARSIKAVVLAIKYATFFDSRGNDIISTFDKLEERFPDLLNPKCSKMFSDSIFIAITKCPDGVDPKKNIEAALNEYSTATLNEIKNIAEQFSGDYQGNLGYETLQRKQFIWQWFIRLMDINHIKLVDPTNRIANKDFLHHLVQASGINKKYYSKAMAGRIKVKRLFSENVHLSLHSWQSRIIEQYLKNIPEQISSQYSEMDSIVLKIEDIIKQVKENYQLIQNANIFMQKSQNQIAECQTWTEQANSLDDNDERLQELLKHAKALNIQEISSYQTTISKLEQRIDDKEQERQLKEEQLEAVNETIAGISEDIRVKKNTKHEKETGTITEILAECAKRDPDDEWRECHWKKSTGNQEVFNELRAVTDEDLVYTGKRTKYRNLNANLCSNELISKSYVLVPVDPTKRSQFLKDWKSSDGDYQATMEGAGYSRNLGINTNPTGNKVLYSFLLHYKGDGVMPWYRIKYTCPKKERYHDDIIILATQISSCEENLSRETVNKEKFEEEIQRINAGTDNLKGDIETNQSRIMQLKKDNLLNDLEKLEKQCRASIVEKVKAIKLLKQRIYDQFIEVEKFFVEIEKIIPTIKNLECKKRQFALIIDDQKELADLTFDFAKLAFSKDKDETSLFEDEHGSILQECCDFVVFYQQCRQKMLDEVQMDIYMVDKKVDERETDRQKLLIEITEGTDKFKEEKTQEMQEMIDDLSSQGLCEEDAKAAAPQKFSRFRFFGRSENAGEGKSSHQDNRKSNGPTQ